MLDKTKKSLHSVSSGEGLLIEKFSAAEALNEFYADNGWKADYRQIEPGDVEITVMGRAVGDVEFFREQTNRRIASSTKSPSEIFSIVLAASGAPCRMHGRRLGMNELLLAPPSSRLDIVPTSGCDVLTIHIPAARFHDYASALGSDEQLDLKSQPTWYATPTTDVDGIRQLALEMLTPSVAVPKGEDIDWTILSALIGMLGVRDSEKWNKDPYGRAEKHRIVQRARVYVHAHLANDIRVSELCDHCGVSLSTLERMFKRELNIAPKDYVLAARLADVRRNLWDDDSQSQTIAEVALNSGFSHMGRFSQQYRKHFGRLPSEDRDVSVMLIEKYRLR